MGRSWEAYSPEPETPGTAESERQGGCREWETLPSSHSDPKALAARILADSSLGKWNDPLSKIDRY